MLAGSVLGSGNPAREMDRTAAITGPFRPTHVSALAELVAARLG